MSNVDKKNCTQLSATMNTIHDIAMQYGSNTVEREYLLKAHDLIHFGKQTIQAKFVRYSKQKR